MRGSTSPKSVQEVRDALNLPVDLRSDTVTKPTAAMRKAMAEAEVGDDVYGEDPTVNRLEGRTAEIFEREAALFVPSGSMGNMIAIRIHCDPGNEVICESRSHTFNFELASMAVIAGCLARPVHSEDGILTWKQMESAIQPKIYYRAQTGLISLENTHNIAGGVVLPPEVQEEICDRARERGIPVHLDGARIFNAAAVLSKSVATITRKVDSIMFCLSKALGAPVGSMLVGSKAFIERARVYRKMLGGGMRQAGVLAAAGLVALAHPLSQLVRDHQNARALAEGLTAIPGVQIDLAKVQTNIVIFDVSGTGMTTEEIAARLKERGVLASGIDPKSMRMVTHYDVDAAGIEHALHAFQHIVRH